MRRFAAFFVLLVGGIAFAGSDRASGAGASPAPPSLSSQQPVLKQYCITCHNERNKANAGNVALDTVRLDTPEADAETLERMVRKLRAGLMPPPGAARPEPTQYRALLASVESALDDAAAKHPNPGRKDTFHR